jgi:hypothetical protein
MKKVPWMWWIEQQKIYFITALELKFQIMFSQCSFSSESSLLGLQIANFLLCCDIEREKNISLSTSSYKSVLLY